MSTRILRYKEKSLEGVPHGYTLSGSPSIRLSNRIGGPIERILLWPWYRSIPIDRPIFITGHYRSGTTVLEEIVTAHPKASFFSYVSGVYYRAPALGNLIQRLFWALGILDKEPIHPSFNPRLLITQLSPSENEWIWSQVKDNLWDDRVTDLTVEAGFSNPDFDDYIRSMIRRHLLIQRTTRFVNKNPANCLRVGYLHKLFPDALFINIVRNPIDTILSHYRTAKKLENIYYSDPKGKRFYDEYSHLDVLSRRIKTCNYARTMVLNQEHPLLGIAHQWCEMQIAILEATRSDQSLASQFLDLRYEELVTRPEDTLGKLWEFAGLADEDAQRITQDYKYRLSAPPEKEPSPEEQQYLPRIRQIVAPVAVQLGYSF